METYPNKRTIENYFEKYSPIKANSDNEKSPELSDYIYSKCENDFLKFVDALNDRRINDLNKALVLLDVLIDDMNNFKFLKQWEQIQVGDKHIFENLAHSIFWHRFLCEIEPNSNAVKKIIKAGPKEEKDLSLYSSLVGSHVLKLYIALVYNRGVLLKALKNQQSLRDYDSINRLKKFLCCDYIRHIRNSLSHGTFDIFSGGIIFFDEEIKVYATSSLLQHFSTWMNIIQLQCLVTREKF